MILFRISQLIKNFNVRFWLYVFFLFFIQRNSNGQDSKLITSSDGLLNSNVLSVQEDRLGFIWIASEKGLLRFDGYQFKKYAIPKLLRTLFLSSNGTLWVGTFSGIFQYNNVLDDFKEIPIYDGNNKVLPEVKTICEDKNNDIWVTSSLGLFLCRTSKSMVFTRQLKGNINLQFTDGLGASVLDSNGILWIGTSQNGLFQFNTFTHKLLDNNINSDLKDKNVASIFRDSNGDIIWGTNSGNAYLLRFKDKKIIECKHQSGSRLYRPIYSICNNKSNQILLGTHGNGIQILDKNTYEIKDASDIIALENASDARINVIYLDYQKNLWIGIQSVGLYFKKGFRLPFNIYQKNSKLELSLNYNEIKSILIDKECNLYIGTDGGGLNFLPKKADKFNYFFKSNILSGAIPDNAIISMLEDRHGRIWIGTYLKGLVLFDRSKRTFQRFEEGTNKNAIHNNYIKSIAEDQDGNLWLGTNSDNLFYFNTSDKTSSRVTLINTTKGNIPVPECIICLLFDSKHRLWIGSYDGLICWDIEQKKIERYNTNNKKLPSNTVLSLHENADGKIAIGSEDGLTILDTRSDIVSQFSKESGLPDNSIQSILEDNHNQLWVSTKNGIAQVNMDNGLIYNYFKNSGLPSNDFNLGASFKDSKGFLYFGGSNGVVYFHPDSIHYNTNPVPLFLTDMYISNQPISAGTTYNSRLILNRALNYTNKVVLQYSENHVSIKFSAIDILEPGNVKYSYKLEGFDKNWITAGYNQNLASYTYLRPGTYKFRVKILKSDLKSDSVEKTLIIQIEPPFWATWWAYLIYIFVIILAILASHKLLVYKLEMQKKLEMEQMKLEHQSELHKSKIELFANVSHEIRTPLTLILGPVESLLKSKPEGFVENYLLLIRRNVTRILNQVNQLLENEKIERHQLTLNISKTDIEGLIYDSLLSFESLKNSMSIDLHINVNTSNDEIWLDKDKVSTIVYNLLSNAFKHTPQGGTISIGVKIENIDSENFAELKITDNGDGIPEEQIEKIFERYYQIGSEKNRKLVGSGIGLHYTKSLVLLHHGTIWAESSLGKGATFFVKLPVNKTFYRKEDIVEDVNSFSLPDSISKMGNTTEANDLERNLIMHSVLIIEDDLEIRNFLKTELSNKYRVIESSNGREGLTFAEKYVPDVIISDIMMPEMDGLELCRKLKTNIQTSHIPIILLTAKISENDQLEGLENGADAYITKPFNPLHLKVRITKLIELREMLKQKFSRTISFEAEKMTVTSTDEKILSKAIDFVKKNIADTELNIEDMSKEVGLSRSQLYRKIKALTDQNPSEFVRTIRLKQAAYLLSTSKINISEVAYMVGFNSHQYFSSCFQRHFSITPTEYAKKKTTES
jgi:Signal transduction histidine kinase